jgi:DNA-binding NtrC family response regulator
VILGEEGQPIDLRHLFGVEGLARSALVHHEHADAADEPGAGEGDDGSMSQLLDRMVARDLALDGFEERVLLQALERAQGNVAEAARLVGLSRPQFAYRLQKYSAKP